MGFFQESPIKESEDDDEDSGDESVIEPKTTSKKPQILSESEEDVSHSGHFLFFFIRF